MVSVIIPNYNHALYINQRIQSVLNQTYQDFEIIIFDDKSTDNSIELIEKYRNHPKVTHILYNNVNSGSPFKQWQKGIELAKGDFIWIAESDDFSDAFFLEKTIEKAIYYKVGVCFTNSHIFSEGAILDEMFKTDNGEGLLIDGTEIIKNWLIFHKGIKVGNTSSAIIKRDLAVKINKQSKFSQYILVGDLVFWIYTLLNTKAYVINEKLNYYRLHNQNTSYSVYKDDKRLIINLSERKVIYNFLPKILSLSNVDKMLLDDRRKKNIKTLNRLKYPHLYTYLGKIKRLLFN